MADQNNAPPPNDEDFMMSGAMDEDETLGEDNDAGSQAATPVVQSIEHEDIPPTDESNGDLNGDLPQASDGNNMPPPPPRARVDSVASNSTDFNHPDVIASLVGPVNDNGNGRGSVPPSGGLNFGNSMLHRRPRQQSVSARNRALSVQRDLASRRNNNHEAEAQMMTSTPVPQDFTGIRSGTPFNFEEALSAYEAANFSNSRPELRYKQRRGKLDRREELNWIRLEALRRRRRSDGRGRSVTPAADDESGGDSAAAIFNDIKRHYEAKKRTGNITWKEEVAYMKIQAKESKRQQRGDGSRYNSRASTPSGASGIFVGGGSSQQHGFGGFGGDGGGNGGRNGGRGGHDYGNGGDGGDPYARRGKGPQRKFIFSSEARKKAKKGAKAGHIPNRTNIRSGPSKGYADDGRGRHVEFGDYFLKVTADEDRPDVIETYLTHVASEISLEILTKGTMPMYSGTPLKDRLRKIRKLWNTKTKEFCRRHGLEKPKFNTVDEDEKRFTRQKSNIYRNIRAGQLTMEQASRFAVEANIEMCRWRAKYHKAIGNHHADTNLNDLNDIDGLQLPTTEEFDESYKPKFDTIIELIGTMFAECQERIRENHDRLHGVFPKIEIPDPGQDETSDEETDEEEEAAAAPGHDKPNAGGDANEDENMFPENEV